MKINVLGFGLAIIVMLFSGSLNGQTAEATQEKVQTLKKEIQTIQDNKELDDVQKKELIKSKKEVIEKLRADVKSKTLDKKALAREGRKNMRGAQKAEIEAIKNNPDLSKEEKEVLIEKKREEMNPDYTKRKALAPKDTLDPSEAYKKHIGPMKAEIKKIKANEELSEEEKLKKIVELRHVYRKSWKDKKNNKKG